ncbi:UNVERIFIED_CONTAM: WPP domain-associated protein [Sesamum angustifolium]|uniref:WPP domain-associated protein n=1 Tax=Sesamum angustifolium TaxID=2727405 RepID=A0AAW2KVE4_9LAMI
MQVAQAVAACVMESQEVLVNGGMSNGSAIISYGNGLEQVNSDNGLEQVGFDEKGRGNLADEVLEDLEEYWEDINDRLMISRMVSDSVIKGMVTAVEQEAAEKIASKELELSNLKWFLQSHEVVTGKFEDVRLPVWRKTFEAGNYGRSSCVTDACAKHEKMREDLHALQSVAGEQFKKAKKEIECARGANSIKKIGSGSELVGLGGILEEKQCESWVHMDKTLECLKTTVDTVCTKVDDILLSSKISLCEWQQDQVLSAKLEDIVIQSVLRSLQEELEENLWEQYVQFSGTQDVNWLEKLNDISSLGNQLDAVLKSLSLPETGLVSHGSHDLENLHHKTLSNHIQSPSLCGENGTLDASDIHVAESYDFQQLRHMPKEELVNYFNNIISKLKRDHESALQQKTEEYFRLKREYLKERRSFVTHRKDEEFDALRKRIPDIISKLENFLLENERFRTITNNLESMEKLKHRLDNLLSENHHLRDSLTNKKNEVKCLEAEILDASEKLSERTLAEENMLKLVENLKSAMEDSCIEASLSEEVYKCALREQIAQRCGDSEDSNMNSLITQEIYDIILREAIITAEIANRDKAEDSDFESLIVQELSGLILTEAIKDAERKLIDLSQEVRIDKEVRISLETEALEKENELRLLVEEKEKLKQEILDMRTAIKQKEKLAMGLSISLSKEREQFELALRELGILREHASRQEILVVESNRELESLRSQHAEALKQIEVDKMEIQKLNQQLDQTKEVLTEANKERNTAFTLTQETHDKLLVSEAREEKLRKEMEMAANGFSIMFDDFACRVSGAVKRNTLRLEDTNSQLKTFSKMATVLRRTGLMYKQKLERKCADLQMAEAEVDLLGDEVDALLRLLEKIYIALDHYSPVLKHYPGIIEILELVRRELSGESTKLL